MKVLAINASPRANGNTSCAIRIVLDELKKEGIETELIHLKANSMRGCIGCWKCKETRECVFTDDGFPEIYRRMQEADGILLGAPVYQAGMPAALKALLERVSSAAGRDKVMFAHKLGAALVVVRRGGPVAALDSINHFFLNKNMFVAGSNYWNFMMGDEPGEVMNDKEGIVIMQTLGRNMAWFLKHVHERN